MLLEEYHQNCQGEKIRKEKNASFMPCAFLRALSIAFLRFQQILQRYKIDVTIGFGALKTAYACNLRIKHHELIINQNKSQCHLTKIYRQKIFIERYILPQRKPKRVLQGFAPCIFLRFMRFYDASRIHCLQIQQSAHVASCAFLSLGTRFDYSE